MSDVNAGGGGGGVGVTSGIGFINLVMCFDYLVILLPLCELIWSLMGNFSRNKNCRIPALIGNFIDFGTDL